jgi:hypothetical protein
MDKIANNILPCLHSGIQARVNKMADISIEAVMVPIEYGENEDILAGRVLDFEC